MIRVTQGFKYRLINWTAAAIQFPKIIHKPFSLKIRIPISTLSKVTNPESIHITDKQVNIILRMIPKLKSKCTIIINDVQQNPISTEPIAQTA